MGPPTKKSKHATSEACPSNPPAAADDVAAEGTDPFDDAETVPTPFDQNACQTKTATPTKGQSSREPPANIIFLFLRATQYFELYEGCTVDVTPANLELHLAGVPFSGNTPSVNDFKNSVGSNGKILQATPLLVPSVPNFSSNCRVIPQSSPGFAAIKAALPNDFRLTNGAQVVTNAMAGASREIAKEFIRRAGNLATQHGVSLDLTRVDLDNDLDTFRFLQLPAPDPAQVRVHLTNAEIFGPWKKFFQGTVSEMETVTSRTNEGRTYYAWSFSMTDFKKILTILKKLGCNIDMRRAAPHA